MRDAAADDVPPPSSRCCPRRVLVAALAIALAANRLLLSTPDRPRQEFTRCGTNVPILVGTHHKTGTVLLKHIFMHEVCPRLRWRCSFDHKPIPCASVEQARAAGLQLCFLQHGVRFNLEDGSSRTRQAPYRFIHAIRDPLEAVLSGYEYHLKTTERWANLPDRYHRYNGSSYRQYLNSLSLGDGLQAELKRSLSDVLKTMPRLLNKTARQHCTLTLRLEDFQRDWSGTVARMWDLLGLDASTARQLDRAVAKHNVYAAKNKKHRKYNKHVSDQSRRGLIRNQLRALPAAYAKIQQVRKELGYPTGHGD
jgi:hypothetical protein